MKRFREWLNGTPTYSEMLLYNKIICILIGAVLMGLGLVFWK